jgi:O-antigen/teichoic acid export membrane protein
MGIRLLLINSLSYGASDIIVKVMQFSALMYLARICTTDDYARIGILISVQQVIFIFLLGGIVEVVMGNFIKYHSHLNVLFKKAVEVSAVSLAVILAIYLLTAGFRGLISVDWITLDGGLAFFTGVMLGAYAIISHFFRLSEKHRMAILFKNFPTAFCYATGIAGLMLFPNDPVTVFFTGMTIGLAVCLPFGLWGWSLFEKAGSMRSDSLIGGISTVHLLRDSLPFLAIAIFGWLSGYGNSIIIKNMLSDINVAEYIMSLNFASMILLVLNSISQVWSARFVRLNSEMAHVKLNRCNMVFCRIQLALVSFVAAGIVIFLGDILRIVKGNALVYVTVLPYVAIMLSGYLVLSLYYQNVNYYLARNEGPLFLRIVIVTSSIGTAAWVLFMHLFGAWGIYAGFLVLMMMRGGAMHVFAVKKWQVESNLTEVALAIGFVWCGFGIATLLSSFTYRAVAYILLEMTMISLIWVFKAKEIREVFNLLNDQNTSRQAETREATAW